MIKFLPEWLNNQELINSLVQMWRNPAVSVVQPATDTFNVLTVLKARGANRARRKHALSSHEGVQDPRKDLLGLLPCESRWGCFDFRPPINLHHEDDCRFQLLARFLSKRIARQVLCRAQEKHRELLLDILPLSSILERTSSANLASVLDSNDRQVLEQKRRDRWKRGMSFN